MKTQALLANITLLTFGQHCLATTVSAPDGVLLGTDTINHPLLEKSTNGKNMEANTPQGTFQIYSTSATKPFFKAGEGYEKSLSPTDGGRWYRIAVAHAPYIASYPNGNRKRADAEFILRDTAAGADSTLRFHAGASYRQPARDYGGGYYLYDPKKEGLSFSVDSHSYTYEPVFTKVRMVVNKSNSVDQYLDVYITGTNVVVNNPTFSNLWGSVSFEINNNLSDPGWEPVNWTQDVTVPAGYEAVEFSVSDVSFGVGSFYGSTTFPYSLKADTYGNVTFKNIPSVSGQPLLTSTSGTTYFLQKGSNYYGTNSSAVIGSSAYYANTAFAAAGGMVNGTSSNVINNAVAMGSGSLASGNHSVALGNSAKSSGSNSVAIGYGSEALGNESSAFGRGLIVPANASNLGSSALGRFNLSSPTAVLTIGNGTSAAARANALEISANSHTTLNRSLQIGSSTASALGHTSLSIGSNTVAYSTPANAETPIYALAVGNSNTVSNPSSVAFGLQNVVNNAYAMATGISNSATAEASFAVGVGSTASGEPSMALGQGVVADRAGMVAVGKYNTETPSGGPTRLFVVGKGEGTASRSDALTVGADGSTTIPGSLTAGSLTTIGTTTAQGRIILANPSPDIPMGPYGN